MVINSKFYVYYAFIISIFLNFIPSISFSYEKDIKLFDQIFFDVVEKDFEFKGYFPERVRNLTSGWINEKVKISGVDGKVSFIFFEYEEKTKLINDGKRVDISMNFNLYITKASLSQKKTIQGKVNSYGEIKGSFTLNDFDEVINNAQTELIKIFSNDIKNKI